MPDLGRRVVQNTLAQIFGRNLIALSRLAIAALIVRTYGKLTFGEYSLIFGLLSMAEWVLDFGTTEISVREICRRRDLEPQLMRMLAAGKLIQIPVAILVITGFLLVFRYPPRIVRAGAVGAISLVFFAGMLTYRAIFKANLTLHREAAAELLSVLFMIPLVWGAACLGAGLAGLLACHVLSRACFFGLCCWFGRKDFALSIRGARWADVLGNLRTSATIGAIGFLVVSYDALDVLALSRLSTAEDLAYFSIAQRLIWPILMALSAVGATLYPVVASFWPHDRAGFDSASQRALNLVLLLAGAAACCAFAGAEFLMGVLGHDLAEGALALRILALLLIVKAISATLGPVLYVVRAQRQALQFIVLAVIVKAAVVFSAAPTFGYVGVATGSVMVELFFAAVPFVTILQRHSGYQVRWAVPARLLLMTVGVIGFTRWLLPGGGIAAALAAASLYAPLALFSGAVNASDLKLVLSRMPA
jgi:O-antigen/teichoic acid export membrane protein